MQACRLAGARGKVSFKNIFEQFRITALKRHLWINRKRAIQSPKDEEHRRNQHSAADGGISGVLDTPWAEMRPPQEPQRIFWRKLV